MHRKILVPVLVAIFFFPGIMHVLAGEDIEEHRSCAQCGMDRKAYGYSRMLVQYEDGAVSGVCSLHCAAKELSANKDRPVKVLQVADRDTRSMIDASQANWVMGGEKRGVMTQMPKWAFQTKPAAEAFIKEYGGKPFTWEEALAAARQELGEHHR